MKLMCQLLAMSICTLCSAVSADSPQSKHPKYQRCDTPYANHGVYDATIVYGVDEVVTGPLLLPMDSERNTDTYRQTAYTFFRERFGLEFDVSDWGPQRVFDQSGASASVAPVKTGEGSTHQVYAVDAQHIPRWHSKLPLTQVAFFDDGYFVTLESDFRVHGSFGGDQGIVLPMGTQLVLGEYRMFDHRDRLLDTISYRSNIPVTAVPVSGSLEGSGGALFVTIACDVESKRFGVGSTRALGEIRPLSDSTTQLDFRYTMHFPAALKDAQIDRARCDRLPYPRYSHR